MKTYVLTLNINNGERKDLECIEGNVYASYDELREKVGFLAKEINIYPLTDFMDACNDQEIALDEIWICYVHVQEKQTVWILEEYDQYFSKASRTTLGVFSSKVNASLAMVDAYSGEERQFRKNGTDQWVSDVLSCGIMIREVELDKFEEL